MVAVEVGVGVTVGVEVEVAVGVGVEVTVGVEVGVWVGVGVLGTGWKGVRVTVWSRAVKAIVDTSPGVVSSGKLETGIPPP